MAMIDTSIAIDSEFPLGNSLKGKDSVHNDLSWS